MILFLAFLACVSPKGLIPLDPDTSDRDTPVHHVDATDDTGLEPSDTGIQIDTGSVWRDTAPVDTDTGYVAADTDTGGFVDTAGDCDDWSPDADMVGDGVDQNCDGLDGVDDDGDGHASLQSGGDDCDDWNPDVQIRIWYEDYDADGYGDPNDYQEVCNPVRDPKLNDLDCDDSDPNVNPDAEEIVGDGIDNDCDGVAS